MQRKQYDVTRGTETTTVTGRAAAVREAREKSLESRRVVRVERKDGKVAMQFKHGSLERYRFDTGHRRS